VRRGGCQRSGHGHGLGVVCGREMMRWPTGSLCRRSAAAATTTMQLVEHSARPAVTGDRTIDSVVTVQSQRCPTVADLAGFVCLGETPIASHNAVGCHVRSSGGLRYFGP